MPYSHVARVFIVDTGARGESTSARARRRNNHKIMGDTLVFSRSRSNHSPGVIRPHFSPSPRFAAPRRPNSMGLSACLRRRRPECLSYATLAAYSSKTSFVASISTCPPLKRGAGMRRCKWERGVGSRVPPQIEMRKEGAWKNTSPGGLLNLLRFCVVKMLLGEASHKLCVWNYLYFFPIKSWQISHSK